MVTVLFVFYSALPAQNGSFLKVQYNKSYQVGDKTYPIELVYTPNDGYIKLRIVFDNDKWSNEKAREFLVAEVLTLTTGERTEIGEGYFFTFVGKYPDCLPHRQYSDTEKNRSWMYMQFTNGGRVAGKEITGIGLEKLRGDFSPCIKK